MLNKLVEAFNQNKPNDSDILIFTDANVLFESDTVFQLIKHFKDPEIAQVGAKVINQGMKKHGISFQENFYISRENDIKYNEGRIFGTMMGAFGACFAHKAKLYAKIPADHVVDDFYLTMKMLVNGYKCILNKDAICYEYLPNNIEVEYNRKKRISIGNYQNLFIFWKALIPTKPGLSFSFFSHKFLRWVTPFLIIFCFISLLALYNSSLFYQWTLYLMIATFFIPVLDKILQKFNIHIAMLRYISYFYSMNLALLHGFFNFARGSNQNIWEPTER
jgi:cellulose synthase/poly-beta-1,6-N-acetylglucosamine synthase-like glycosyltransferase